MNKILLVLAGFAFVLILAGSVVIAKNSDCTCGQYCVDADCDGICDLCDGCIPQGADDDGDGIPNGQDDDYVPPQDGTGAQKGK